MGKLIEHTQETSLQDTRHVPFQDAILFDMLLDIVADDLVPHQRRLDDGLAFQLEILEALERAQTHAVAVKAMRYTASPSASESSKYSETPRTSLANEGADKKRVSMTDRLKNKKIKVEL